MYAVRITKSVINQFSVNSCINKLCFVQPDYLNCYKRTFNSTLNYSKSLCSDNNIKWKSFNYVFNRKRFLFPLKKLTNKSFFCTSSRNLLRFSNESQSKGSRSTLYYLTAVGILAIGLSYAAVPLYRIFCQVCMNLLFIYYRCVS